MDAADDVVDGKLRLGTRSMETTEILVIGREAIWTVLSVAAPVLLTALSVGLIVGVIQAATSIQEMTLSFIPKLAVMVIALIIFGEWQLALLVDYFEIIFERIRTITF